MRDRHLLGESSAVAASVAMANRQRSGLLALISVVVIGHLFFSGTLRPLTFVDVASVREPNRRKLNMIDAATWSNVIGDIAPHNQGPSDVIYSFNSRQELKYRQRNQRVSEVCRRRGILKSPVVMDTANATNLQFSPLEVERPSVSHFSVAKSFRTMGCFLNKVASSSLVSAFLAVRGFRPEKLYSPHSLVSLLRPSNLDEFGEANETYFKFLFVRHPMDRLLSCYLDKMVQSDHVSLPPYRRYVQKTGRKIIRTRQAKKLRTFTLSKSIKKEQANPTFEEFLEFILNTNLEGVGYESHWVPYSRYCAPCSVTYDVIGKLETAADDFRYVWSRAGLGSKTSIPWVNRVSSPSRDEIDLKRRYYSSLPRDLILRVFQRFRIDFEMFDYSINDTLLRAGYAPLTDNSWLFQPP